MTVARQEWIHALDRVIELGFLLEQDQRVSLDRMGLTPSRVQLVWVLGMSGPHTHRALADQLGIVPRSVTDLVDGLELIGLVTRGPHATDRRASVVTLTTQGRAVMKRLQKDQQRFATALFNDFPDDLLEPLTRSLDHLLATLRPLVEEGSK
ncbi:MAG: MarR family winged helix-turn-helix transcriptional regulator [Actinomycetota bacterium]|nr:MarR family winged helix-turn-helix transcriptional regulator [Actinomycetota bacterium]